MNKVLDNSNKKEKKTILNSIIKEVTDTFGEGKIVTLNNFFSSKKSSFSTGSFFLDKATGGGYPIGKITEIYGREGSGKTTISLHAIRECQLKGKIAIYFDVENSIDKDYAEKIGVDIDNLIIIYPGSAEECFKIMMFFLEENNKNIGLMVIDSVSALVPKAEITGEAMNSQTVGLLARVMSKGLRFINNLMTKNKEISIIFINQLRDRISTSFFVPGGGETTTGGRALGYFSSLRMSVKESKKIIKDEKPIGFEVAIEIKKNRFFSPYKKISLELIFGKGIQKEREIMNIALEKKIIEKSGNWYHYEGKKIANGKENALIFLLNNKKEFDEIIKKIEKENTQENITMNPVHYSDEEDEVLE